MTKYEPTEKMKLLQDMHRKIRKYYQWGDGTEKLYDLVCDLKAKYQAEKESNANPDDALWLEIFIDELDEIYSELHGGEGFEYLPGDVNYLIEDLGTAGRFADRDAIVDARAAARLPERGYFKFDPENYRVY